MTFKNLAWASEQSKMDPGAKLLAIFIASQADCFGRARFATQDAAAWCCFPHPEVAQRLTYQLANSYGLRIVRFDSEHDILTFEVIVPAAKNGGELL